MFLILNVTGQVYVMRVLIKQKYVATLGSVDFILKVMTRSPTCRLLAGLIVVTQVCCSIFLLLQTVLLFRCFFAGGLALRVYIFDAAFVFFLCGQFG